MTRRVLFLILALLTAPGCSYKKVEREIGHVGPARRDPFLAAGRFIQGRGISTFTTTRFSTNTIPWDATIITPAQSFVVHGMTTNVLNWVSRGGHLVVFLRDGEAYRNDWLPFSLRGDAQDPETDRLLEELGVEAVKHQSLKAKGEILERKVEYESPATFTWRKGEMPYLKFVVGDPDEPAAASFAHGSGNVTLIASAQPFRNRYIGENDHARLFWLLTTHADTDDIYFLQGARLSFFAMLWEHGWMAVIGLLLLIAFWLWRHLPRFGPLRNAPEQSTRDFASHLGVIGAFHWKHGQTARLLAPLRDSILRAASRHGWAGAQDRFHENLGAVAGLPPERARAALELHPADPQSFVAVVQDLQKLATALRA